MSETKKNIEEMSDHELLEELVRMNREKRTMRIILCIAAVITAAALIITMAVLVPQTMASMQAITQLTEDAEGSLKEIDKIDFDTLNQGITDFSKIVGSLSNWFK